MSEEFIDVWGDEGGMQLTLTRHDNGHVTFAVHAVVGFSERRNLGEVTVARFRVGRIANFLVPQETEEQHKQAVEHVRNLIREAPMPESPAPLSASAHEQLVRLANHLCVRFMVEQPNELRAAIVEADTYEDKIKKLAAEVATLTTERDQAREALAVAESVISGAALHKYANAILERAVARETKGEQG